MIGAQLQDAIRDRLVAQNITGGRIYDRIPPNAVFPYVAIGDEQSIDDGDQCADIFEVYVDLHVWSRADGRYEAKEVGEAIRKALAADLTVADYHIILSEFENARILDDPDGLTTHGVITFRYLLQPVLAP
ncbi:DUF3168 domain-containing protein [Aliihoeflea sp. 40Bstr573]|uniref:DUF3168 domain-containing protein n=1 Tax=Aliihoeflea sp. 40Bstr573 TaxID=2696467 RepID=UPI0020954593|nr:DUF3168 domain-containing protein [Aliihoeflea sp. 40Bstr573]MCO6386237.1 DUF3168 domain-containing protein [Aliihoeflea sp. 40Bstr573]